MKKKLSEYSKIYIRFRELTKGDKWDKLAYIAVFAFYIILLIVDMYHNWCFEC